MITECFKKKINEILAEMIEKGEEEKEENDVIFSRKKKEKLFLVSKEIRVGIVFYIYQKI